MFDIGSSELLLIIIVAIVVIGPKDLPRALYKVGQVVGKARGMARHFRTGIDAMVREAELEELQKQWAQENERIMAESRLPDFTSMSATDKPVDQGAVETTGTEAETTIAATADEGPPPFQTDPGPAPEQADPAEAPKGSSAA